MVSDRATIVLTGMPCSGKSSVCRELNNKKDLTVIDLDEKIEVETGRRVTDIIRVDGIARFRELETENLLECLKVRPSFLSLGGGALTTPANIVAMEGAGAKLICLTAAVSVLAGRARDDELSYAFGHPKRPLLYGEGEDVYLAPERKILALLYERWKYYSSAHYMVSTTFVNAVEVANQLAVTAREGCFNKNEVGFRDCCLLLSSSEMGYQLWIGDKNANASKACADVLTTVDSWEELQAYLLGVVSLNNLPGETRLLLIDSFSLVTSILERCKQTGLGLPDPRLLCAVIRGEEWRVKDIWPTIEEALQLDFVKAAHFEAE